MAERINTSNPCSVKFNTLPTVGFNELSIPCGNIQVKKLPSLSLLKFHDNHNIMWKWDNSLRNSCNWTLSFAKPVNLLSVPFLRYMWTVLYKLALLSVQLTKRIWTITSVWSEQRMGEYSHVSNNCIMWHLQLKMVCATEIQGRAVNFENCLVWGTRTWKK